MNNKGQTSKTIDWESSLKLANNKPALAKELLTLLVNELPQFRTHINDAYVNKDFKELHRHIHKLHGATCYCGVPKLREIAALL
jgi:two-component system sensor histidine kinase BarA